LAETMTAMMCLITSEGFQLCMIGNGAEEMETNLNMA
jgi:hypothetical protein